MQHALHQHPSSEHVHFDEVVIQEHDLDRGTRMKIDEPKTPYTEDVMEDEGDAGGTGGSGGTSHHSEDVQMHSNPTHHVLTKEEEEIKKHLEEAERNKLLNAQLQKELAANKANQKTFHSELTEKLDNTHATQEVEEHKHQEFMKKRKDHYKNEANAAVLLKQKLPIEDEEEEQGNQ